MTNCNSHGKKSEEISFNDGWCFSPEHSHASIPFLSIIIPCYNVVGKCDELMRTLSVMEDDIELVFIDDGSTDETWSLLKNFVDARPSGTISLVKQLNRGAGGARNTGISISRGRFIWTVDADDDFNPLAIKELRQHVARNVAFDFIDFDMADDVYNSTNRAVGRFFVDEKIEHSLVKSFGGITTKIFSRKFVERSGFSYPESVNSEDSCLAFYLPYHVRSYIKSPSKIYCYNRERTSRVSRGYDERDKVLACIWARANCLAKGANFYRLKPAVLLFFSSRIRDDLLRNPLRNLLSLRRPASILDAAACFRFYKDVMKDLGFYVERPSLEGLAPKQIALAKIALIFSKFLPRQHEFFRKKYEDLQPVSDGLERRNLWKYPDWNVQGNPPEK